MKNQKLGIFFFVLGLFNLVTFTGMYIISMIPNVKTYLPNERFIALFIIIAPFMMYEGMKRILKIE